PIPFSPDTLDALQNALQGDVRHRREESVEVVHHQNPFMQRRVLTQLREHINKESRHALGLEQAATLPRHRCDKERADFLRSESLHETAAKARLLYRNYSLGWKPSASTGGSARLAVRVCTAGRAGLAARVCTFLTRGFSRGSD